MMQITLDLHASDSLKTKPQGDYLLLIEKLQNLENVPWKENKKLFSKSGKPKSETFARPGHEAFACYGKCKHCKKLVGFLVAFHFNYLKFAFAIEGGFFMAWSAASLTFRFDSFKEEFLVFLSMSLFKIL